MACCEIKEICSNIPILLTVHMSKFLTVIWTAIRDKDNVRDMAIAAVRRAIGAFTSKGELSEKLYNECSGLLRPDSNVNIVYGAVTILNDLLKHSLINDHCP
jgi:hypothetical protein